MYLVFSDLVLAVLQKPPGLQDSCFRHRHLALFRRTPNSMRPRKVLLPVDDSEVERGGANQAWWEAGGTFPPTLVHLRMALQDSERAVKWMKGRACKPLHFAAVWWPLMTPGWRFLVGRLLLATDHFLQPGDVVHLLTIVPAEQALYSGVVLPPRWDEIGPLVRTTAPLGSRPVAVPPL